MKKILIIAFLGAFCSCSKDAEIQDLFSDFTITPNQVLADGQSVVDISVVLNEETDSDRRKVIFKASSGTFVGATPESATVDATYVNGRLVASAKLKVSAKPGTVKVSVEPAFDSPIQEFVLATTFETIQSTATSVTLASSSFGIASNFISEVQFTGTLRNSDNKPVSSGNAVKFDDFLPDGSPAHGQFREIKAITEGNSTVSSIYSASLHPINTQIEVRCTILDSDGNLTDHKSSVYLLINQ